MKRRRMKRCIGLTMLCVGVLVSILFIVPDIGPYTVYSNISAIIINLIAIIACGMLTFFLTRFVFHTFRTKGEKFSIRVVTIFIALFFAYLTGVSIYAVPTYSVPIVRDLIDGPRTDVVVECSDWEQHKYRRRGVSRPERFELHFIDGRTEKWAIHDVGTFITVPDVQRIRDFCNSSYDEVRTLTWYPHTKVIARFE